MASVRVAVLWYVYDVGLPIRVSQVSLANIGGAPLCHPVFAYEHIKSRFRRLDVALCRKLAGAVNAILSPWGIDRPIPSWML